MSTTSRQKDLYTDTVSIYKPVNQSTSVDVSGLRKGPKYELVDSGVACKYFGRDRRLVTSPFGAVPASARAEYDAMHFYLDQDVEEGWIFKLTTSGHPYVNRWFQIVSAPGIVPIYTDRKGNLKMVLVAISSVEYRIT